jgi:hypothetical protein
MRHIMGSRNVERDKPICSEHMKLEYLAKQYPDWGLQVSCRGCTHSAQFYPDRLLKRLGKGSRLGDVMARLACKNCGCRMSLIKPVFIGKRRD